MVGQNAIRVTRAEDIHLEHLTFRYPTRSALTMDAEIRQVAACVAQGFPKLTLQPLRDAVLDIVGYGPTLRQTWSEIRQPCMTMSGSHDFLLARGIVPTWHTQCDGRDHNNLFVRHPHHGVTYVMASICPPSLWPQLKSHRVLYWHNCHGQHIVDWIGAHDEGSILVAGGTTIGMNAIHIGGILGFRRFRLFGIDCHWADEGHRHADRHYDPVPHKRVECWANGRRWVSSPQMVNSCSELLPLWDNPELSLEIMGESLQGDFVADAQRSKAFWERVYQPFTSDWIQTARAIARDAEPRRGKAKFNTGTIPEAAAVSLMALAQWATPKVVIEVGTFIGTSTMTLAKTAERIYTCDASNDCLKSTEQIQCFPYQTSSQMFKALVKQGVKADFWFLDGRLRDEDVNYIRLLASDGAVFVFDDYTGHEKGVCNVEKLFPHFPHYRLITPIGIVKDTMTLAVLAPLDRL